jgi:hypothetical protein
VTRVLTPEQAGAEQGKGRLRPIAIERGLQMIDLPPNAQIEADRAYWPNDPSQHLIEPATVVPVSPTDRVRMRGTFETRVAEPADQPVPTRDALEGRARRGGIDRGPQRGTDRARDPIDDAGFV